MGSPEFALPALRTLVRICDVIAVVTQPDRPAGRGSKLRPPPVKVAAESLGIPVYQPESLRRAEPVARLVELEPDVIVVAAFGQMLPPSVLDLPPHGCLNIHASLLPRWRGAAPIAAAILAGDTETGVTLMKMDEGMDTGPILAQRAEPIYPDDTTGSLSARLAQVGADLLAEVLPAYLRGDVVPQPQPGEGVTYCRPLKKDDGRLDWSRTAVELERQVRAMIPWPGAFTTWKGRQLKVWRAVPVPEWRGRAKPGEVIPLDEGVGVATGQGALQLLEVQLAGKRPLPVEEFLHGQRDFVGSVLGS